MKRIFQNHSIPVTRSQTLAVVLTGILSLGASMTLLQAAFAAPAALSESSAKLVKVKDVSVAQSLSGGEAFLKQQQSDRLPPRVANAVLVDLSRQTGINVQKFSIKESSRQKWTDGCLGLGTAAEICAAVIVPGWRVVVTDGSKTWVYRTDNTGRTVRQESSNSPVTNLPGNLPQSVATPVKQDAAKRLNLTTDQVRIVQADKKTWSDGCLGLYEPNILCSQATVEGWQVIVEANQQRWVYRTNSSGSIVKLDQTASLPNPVKDAVLQRASRQTRLSVSQLRVLKAEQKNWDGCLGLGDRNVACPRILIRGWQVTVEAGKQILVYHANEDATTVRLNRAASQIGNANTINPTKIPTSELPPSLGKDVLFRTISSGGITGRTYQTTLFNDGRMIRQQVSSNGATSAEQKYQISRRELQQFQQILNQAQLAKFNQLSYPASQGAADYITVTISSKQGTTRYVDMVQDRLPEPLQEVIQGWNQIIRA